MGKMEDALRYEISRLARKEIRAACDPVAKDVRELKRAVRTLEKSVGDMQKKVEELYGQAIVEKAELAAPKEKVKKARMSPRLIKKLRQRKGLTQAQLAALVEVNPSSVTFWERGRSRPTGANFEALVALRDLGKREVKELLAEKAPELGPPGPAHKPRRRGRPKKGE
jgi:DNA-binding transcriptional regulator YiaG